MGRDITRRGCAYRRADDELCPIKTERASKALDLTREDLAGRIGCAAVTLYKIESDERRPSKQIAELLAEFLNIPPAEHTAFIQFARAETIESSVPWGTPFHPPTNLPAQPTLLIGRDEDVVAIGKRLRRDESRLLTLVGPPGIGKTRLALQVASEALDNFTDEVFFIALAPISDANLVATTIASTLGVPDIGPQTPLERLKAFLRDKQMLLVLDNFEQILAAAAQIAELLTVCPLLKIIVTSRAPLRIRQERQIPVSPLSIPDLAHLSDVENMAHYSAVTLFLERAQAVKPDFSLNVENAPTVAAICARLDGLPLAIELISARVKLLSPAALLERLGGRLMLQSDGLRDIEPRHRTLNAAIDWSYQLLSADEQTLFRRLGVFVGGWSLEAAESVCVEDLKLNVLDGMASLLDKNLVKQDTRSEGEPRFMMLETIREYALARLVESGEEQAIRQAHATYFVMLAERTESELDPAGYRRWLNNREVDLGNLRVALNWCENYDIELGLRLIVTGQHLSFLTTRGHVLERGERIEKLLAVGDGVSDRNPSLWARVLNMAARLAYVRGDDQSFYRWAEEGLRFSREIGDVRSRLFALRSFGHAAALQTAYDAAESFLVEGLILAREVGDDWFISHFLHDMGLVARNLGDYNRALSYHEEAVKLVKQTDDKSYSLFTLFQLGTSWLFKENYEQGRQCYVECLSLSNEAIDFVYSLEGFGGLAAAQKQPERAARLLGAAEALREVADMPRMRLDQYYEHFAEATRDQMDEVTFASAWAEGRTMSLEQVVAYALDQYENERGGSQ